ncbi:MAG: hypothetical protein QXW24_07060 [Ignisphaera sp.]
MVNLKTRLLSIIVISMVIASLATPIAISFAEGDAEAVADDASRLVAKALAMQVMLRNALALNISVDLVAEIETLLNVNVSSLSVEELKQFIERSREILARIEHEIRVAWKLDLGNIYAERLRRAIESRARVMEKLYNVSLDEVVANISRVRNRVELMKILKDLDRVIEKARLKIFTAVSMEYGVSAINTTIERLEERTVIKAYMELGKVVDVLKKIRERLEALNISDEVVKHIDIAIEHISIAKEVLANISANMSIQLPSIDREKVREVVNKTLEKIYERTNKSLYELKKEVDELLERALEANATEIVEKLESIVQKLNDIEKELQRTNISIVELNKIIMSLARIKTEIKKIEFDIERQLREVPVRSIDNAFNVTLSKAIENLEKLKEMYRFVENKSKIVCIAIYPPPPACRFLTILPILLNQVNTTITIAEKMIDDAIELYNNGNKVKALQMVVRANTMITIAKAQLEPIYRLLKASDTARGKSDEEVRSELDKKLNSFTLKLNSLEAIFNGIKNRVERIGNRVAKATLERIINDVENMIKNVKELINDVKNMIRNNDLENALAIIEHIDEALKDIELKINTLQKMI